MGYPTDRVMLFDRDMTPLRELAPSEVTSRRRHEEVNGQHELTLVTTRRMEEGWRALTVDGTGRWREWVVVETPEEHSDGGSAVGTYRLVWSLQYDLTNSYSHTHAEIGYGAMPKTAQQAAAVILEGVPRWTVGPCDGAAITEGGCVFIYESAWSRLSKAVELTGWEVDAVIEVSNVFGVTARKLCLKAHVGSEEATRRFDWGHDVTSIRRTPDPGPYYCRVVPLGKGETEYAEDDETTFEWPTDITEETGGRYWIEDPQAAAAFRISDGEGGWIYPTKAVSYSEDDPELLLAMAEDDLHNHTRPNVTYEGSVVQFAEAGMDAYGVELGDDVQIVDRGFNPGSALRLQGRVTAMDVDELSPRTDTDLTIGNLRDNMAGAIMQVGEALDDLSSKHELIRNKLADLSTARYIDELLDRINTEINATGGYAYFVPGEGVITYDRAVADPTVATEATQVVQIKGGSIRIANSKQPGFSGIDDWDWKTVFTSGHILSDLVTTVKVTAGYIGNATNGNWWNLDTGEFVQRTLYIEDYDASAPRYRVSQVGMGTLDQISASAFRMVTELVTSSGRTLSGLFVTSPPVSQSSTYNPKLYLLATSFGGTCIASNGRLRLSSNITETDANKASLSIEPDGMRLDTYTLSRGVVSVFQADYDGIETRNVACDGISIGESSEYGNRPLLACGSTIDYQHLRPYYVQLNGRLNVTTGINCDDVTVDDDVTVGDRLEASYVKASTLSVSGSKSRIASTDDYGKRLLFCYETPTPEFGDIGSGTTDADGLCYVSIDDIFAETASTSAAYQVFLQKCGQGDLWVEEKRPTHFVVRGTPSLAFDWEVKARQTGFENLRLESDDLRESGDGEHRDARAAVRETEGLYDGETDVEEPYYSDYVSEMEALFDEELMAS